MTEEEYYRTIEENTALLNKQAEEATKELQKIADRATAAMAPLAHEITKEEVADLRKKLKAINLEGVEL